MYYGTFLSLLHCSSHCNVYLAGLDLFADICHPNLKYVEACLRCLRTLYMNPHTPVEMIYQVSPADTIMEPCLQHYVIGLSEPC